jgi:hypothetical protein
VERKRQVIHIQRPHIDIGSRDQLRPVDQQVGPPLPVRLGVPAGTGQRPHLSQRRPGAQEIRRPRAAHQLGPRIDQRRQMRQVQLPGHRVKPRQPTLHPPPEPRQDLPAQPMPGDIVGVVLHHRRHHVVPVTEPRQQRIHHRVDRLGRIPVQGDALPAGCPDEPGDRVVGLLKQRGHRLRRTRLPPVHILIPRPQRGVQPQQLTRRLRTRRVVRHHPPQPGELEMPADGPDIHRNGIHRFAAHAVCSRLCVAAAGRFGGAGFVDLHRGCPRPQRKRRLVADPFRVASSRPLAGGDRHDRVCEPAGQAASGTPSPSFAARVLGNLRIR